MKEEGTWISFVMKNAKMLELFSFAARNYLWLHCTIMAPNTADRHAWRCSRAAVLFIWTKVRWGLS